MPTLPTPTKTLLALTLAAAFGGFAATAIRDGLQPAQASPAAVALTPMVGQLPGADAGQGHARGGQRPRQVAGADPQPVRQ